MTQPHRLGASSPNAEPDATRLMLNVLWLIRLRWVAVFGQLATISFTALVLEVRLWLAPLLAIVSLTALTNIAATFGLRSALARYPAPTVWRATRWATAMVMLLDLISLTGLLYFAGGPTNPFALFYFVNVALAAVLLPARSGWLLTAVALGCLAMLFFGHIPVAELSAPAVEDGAAHLRRWGFLAANIVAACVVTYFITRVTGELRQRELELRDAARREARSQRLQSLATLAAGAGHELATPLSTIAVVANELSKHLQGAKVPSEVLDDVSLIRSEVTRCRSILNRMSASAGQAAGEAVKALAPQAIVDEVLRGLRTSDRVCVTIDRSARDTRLTAPLEGLAQAIRGLVQNALDATEPEGQVELRVATTDSPAVVRFEVRDRGPGMSEDVLHRAGEPFFTTKEPGQGMGLGLFLTRSVVERLGGKMTLESSQNVLTLAIVELPLRAP